MMLRYLRFNLNRIASKICPIIPMNIYAQDHECIYYNCTFYDLYFQVSKISRHSKLNIHLHTSGGNSRNCLKACQIIKDYPQETCAFVENLATSAGTMVALACDEIKMSDHASLGPIDCQINLTSRFERIPLKDASKFVEDEMKYKITELKKEAEQSRKDVESVIKDKYKDIVMDILHDNNVTHHQLFRKYDLRKAGIDIKDL